MTQKKALSTNISWWKLKNSLSVQPRGESLALYQYTERAYTWVDIG